MKTFFTLVFVLLVLATVVGGGGLLFYLSSTTEFSRKDRPRGMSAAASAVPGMSRGGKPAAAPAQPAPAQPPAPTR